jgi:exosome complex RNA-binding protein Rrp42 (RNase PH superfamily)
MEFPMVASNSDPFCNKMDGQQYTPSSSTVEQRPPNLLCTLQEWLDIVPTTTTTTTTTTAHSTQSESILQSLDAQQYVVDFWQQRTRPDGRLFPQGRSCKVVMGIIKEHSAGSALVNVTTGNNNNNISNSSSTKILAATTLQIGQPSPEQPHLGDVVVQVSGTGGKNLGMDFLAGGGGGGTKSKHSWEVLQAWLQRVLEEEQEVGQQQQDVDGLYDGTTSIPSQLNLLTGKAALRLVMSVQIIEDGGNVMDAALLACMAAWKDTKLPQLGKDLVDVGGVIYWKQNGIDGGLSSSSPMQVDTSPCRRDFRVSLTMGIWKDPKDHTTHLLVDPSLQEESFLDGRLTAVIGLASGKLQVQYTGKVALTATDLALASKFAQARADELCSILS